MWLVVALAAAAHDPLTSTGMPRWLVTCSCGWERETVPEWAARSVSKLHSQLAPMDVAHVTRVDGATDEVLREWLGLPPERITALRAGGVV